MCIHILHLEDDIYDADLVQATLQEDALACRITYIQTREEFSQALAQGRYDVILADYSLPGYDGMSALRLAQARSPETPFIFVSGVLGEEAAIEALTQGATDYVLKHTLARLAPAITRALEEAENRRERRRAEAALRESEVRYRSLFEHSPIAIWEEDFSQIKAIFDDLKAQGVTDLAAYCSHHPDVVRQCAEALRITDINQAALALHEASSKDQLLQGVVVTFTEDSYAVFAQELIELWNGRTDMANEAVVRTLRGQLRHVIVHFAVCPGHETTLSRVLVSFDDISERTQAEQELTAYREQLEDLVAERTKALEQEVLERRKIEQALQQAKDVAEAANRAKSVFLANMSHELRTPLNAILGFAQLLERDPNLTPDWQEKLTIILRSGEHLLRLINDVLDLSKIEAGRLTLQHTTVDLWDLLDMLDEMLRERAGQKGLQFTVIRGSDVPQYIMADEVKLRQVLVNLVNNAIKFTEAGTVTVNVSNTGAQTAEEGAPHAQITHLKFDITDTGIGIAPDEIETIFGPFTQSQHSSQIVDGSGLGLAISRAFVTLMGGEIRVASELGKGSCFSFVIPGNAVENDSVLLAGFPSRIIGLSPNQQGYRILIVDDNEDHRIFLTQLLRLVGFLVQGAENGQEALTQVLHWQPHLVFMDMRMPVMDGYEATRRIRASEAVEWTEAERLSVSEKAQEEHAPGPHPSTQRSHITIVALTSHAFEEDKTDILASGCDDFLRKPVKEADIFDMLQRYLGVQYEYETPQQIRPDRRQQHAKQDTLTPEMIAALPLERVNRIEKAIVHGDVELIAREVALIRSVDAAAADALDALTRRFEYDTILTMIQQIREEKDE